MKKIKKLKASVVIVVVENIMNVMKIHCPKHHLTVCYGMLAAGIIGPYYFENKAGMISRLFRAKLDDIAMEDM